jgi:uncharacterized protein (DUF362 family)
MVQQIQPPCVSNQQKKKDTIMPQPHSPARLTRRDFIRTGVLGLTALGLPRTLFAADTSTQVWMIHGTNNAALMRRALSVIDANGGFGRNARSLALKVNAAWAREPETGANTHPELVDEFLKGCRASGISEITLPEHPCARAEQSFTRSGILDVAKANNAEMIALGGSDFEEVEIPNARNLRSAKVASQYLESDVVINMPVAKHHGGATLTISMKNWMGAVQDRGFWHRNDLHQCIADFSSFMKPRWSLVDATRIMKSRGPQGPSRDMEQPNLLIISRDQVAADTVAATLFHDDPTNAVKYLKIAGDMGIGETNLNRMTIHKIEA